MTVADAQLAFPFILLAIGIIAVPGPVVSQPDRRRRPVRLGDLRAGAPRPRCSRFAAASSSTRSWGSEGPCPGILLRHILPNVASTLMVIATLELARAIVLEATLSFLGLGIQPPTPSWGGMIHEGREYLDTAWWISVCPGVVLMLTSAGGEPHRGLAPRRPRPDPAGRVARERAARRRDRGGRHRRLLGVLPRRGRPAGRRARAGGGRRRQLLRQLRARRPEPLHPAGGARRLAPRPPVDAEPGKPALHPAAAERWSWRPGCGASAPRARRPTSGARCRCCGT